MIDKEIQVELHKKYNPEGSQLRKAQLRMLEMLKFIDNVCKKNNITYWLDSGTLLGAVRHGGFIPWDDDTDICMPLKDMIKFKKLMINNHLSDEFVLQCHETDSAYNRSQWLVLRDLKSEYIQTRGFHKNLKFRGLQVDIFTLEENVPLPLKKIVDCLQGYLIDYPNNSNKLYFKVLRPFRNFSWIIINHFIIPLFRLVKSKKDYYYMTYGIAFYKKRYMSHIYPLKRIDFEGYSFYAPQDCDKYLSCLYGNWQTIPADNEIQVHNVEILFK